MPSQQRQLRPPKAPRSSSTEPRWCPMESPRPQQQQQPPQAQIQHNYNHQQHNACDSAMRRPSEAVHASPGPSPGPTPGPSPGNSLISVPASLSLEDEADTNKDPSSHGSRMATRSRRPVETPLRPSKAASTPHIQSVPENACPAVPQLEKIHRRPVQQSCSVTTCTSDQSSLYGSHDIEPPSQDLECIGNDPMESCKELSEHLAKKLQLQPAESTDCTDDKHAASDPPLTSRTVSEAEMVSASASHGQSSYDTGSITPLSARANVVPAAVHHHAVVPCASWTTIPNTNGYVAVTTSSAPQTAPQLQNHQQVQSRQHHAVFPGLRTSVPTVCYGTVPGDSVAVNARSSTRQLQVFPTTGQIVGVVAAPQPPASLLLHNPTQLVQAATRTRVPTSPVIMGSPVLRTQPRRLP